MIVFQVNIFPNFSEVSDSVKHGADQEDKTYLHRFKASNFNCCSMITISLVQSSGR